MARNEALRTYRKKRDFARTPEPSGEEGVPATGRSYVIQKHAARRLHHDFRLEVDGVLKSWAVPKGPPAQPGSKVLAVRTEDHPLAYGGFEGVIPQGEYGGGTVMLWDRGTWRPEGDARAGLRAGKLDFVLEGERLRGRWSLVRMAGRAGEEGKENWLLIKRSDDGQGRTASPGLDESVSTGRSMADIAAGTGAVWKSSRQQSKQSGTKSSKKRSGSAARPHPALEPGQLPGARKAAQPRMPAPQLATLVDRAPDGDEWLHEIKFDGYRLLAVLAGGRVRLLTRTGQDWTARFQRTATAIADLPMDQAVLDGEVVVLRQDGVSDFQALQNSLDRGDPSSLVYFAFDLPHCGGFDLTGSPLLERKRLLERLLGGVAKGGPLRYSEHVLGNGPVFLEKACGMHLEGIVSKRADAPYQDRRTRTWLKSKCLQRQEFVIGGWTDPEGSRSRFGALLLGVHKDGALHYAGRVGTGFTGESLAAVARKLAPLATDRSPFVDPPRGAAVRSVHWVRPEAVAEVAFTEWTGDGLLRHPSFQGLREDKPAADVRPEKPKGAALAEPASVLRGAEGPTVAGVRISHPERVLYPELGLTKLDLARYYERVAERLLPYLVDRPLSVVRCPDGTAGQCFFQKHLTAGMPKGVRGIRVQERSGSAEYIAVDDAGGLLGLVQFGVIEFHPWGSRGDLLDRPDRIVIDLDPAPDVPWAQVVEGARRLRELLQALKLESFARTTGGKGLHVVVPIERRSSWEEVKTFARELAAVMAREEPERYVLVASKQRRQGRIFLDYLRNDHGATAVASWSARARAGATVAMPLRWQEVTAKLDPAAFTVPAVSLRLRRADPWAGIADVRQSLTGGLQGRLRKT